MLSILDTRLAAWSFAVSVLAATAQASGAQTPGFSFDRETVVLLAFAQILILWGYLGSSFPQWANWHDGTRVQRYQLLQGISLSLLAGNIAFLLAMEYQLTRPMAMISAALGGYGGDRFINPIMEKALHLLGTAVGKQPGRTNDPNT